MDQHRADCGQRLPELIPLVDALQHRVAELAEVLQVHGKGRELYRRLLVQELMPDGKCHRLQLELPNLPQKLRLLVEHLRCLQIQERRGISVVVNASEFIEAEFAVAAVAIVQLHKKKGRDHLSGRIVTDAVQLLQRRYAVGCGTLRPQVDVSCLRVGGRLRNLLGKDLTKLRIGRALLAAQSVKVDPVELRLRGKFSRLIPQMGEKALRLGHVASHGDPVHPERQRVIHQIRADPVPGVLPDLFRRSVVHLPAGNRDADGPALRLNRQLRIVVAVRHLLRDHDVADIVGPAHELFRRDLAVLHQKELRGAGNLNVHIARVVHPKS